MRYTLFIVFLLIGVSHGFFRPISQIVNNVGNTVQTTANQLGQTAESFWKDVTNHIGTVIGRLVNTVQEIQRAAEFLWDNVFSPAFDKMIQGGQTLVNGQLNGITNAIGRPITISDNPLSEKYLQLVARLKSNIHHLYENLFLMQKEALTSLQNGEFSFEERIRAFYDKIEAIYKQLNDWATETKLELETHAQTIQGDWLNIVNQYSQNIDATIKTLITMFQQLVENFMKNFIQIAQTIFPNTINAIQNMKEQGLLTFLPA